MRLVAGYRRTKVKKIATKTRDIVTAQSACLSCFLLQSLGRNFESIRLGRTGWALVAAGLKPGPDLFLYIVRQLVNKQSPDGGWADPEETAWAAGFIGAVRGREDDRYRAAVSWLRSVRKPGGGWGRHPRDQARIPVTGLISVLVPEVFEKCDLDWMVSEWQRDFEGPVRLSYKAGFFLLGMAHGQRNDLVVRTIGHLAEDQNDDGGFGPWKDHPIGSDPWSTGVVLWGLSKWIDQVDPLVIEKALDWLGKSQLPSGYWRYHYLDDGTSLALIGAVSAMKALAVRERSCAGSS
jgi:hypothetical protein